MPTYEYRCAKCGEHLEVFQSFSEAPLTKHQGCGGKLAKVLSAAGIVLKGSGFYKTDNRKGNGAKKERTSETTKSDSSKSDSSSSSDSSGSSSSSNSSDSSSSSSSSSSGEAKSA